MLRQEVPIAISMDAILEGNEDFTSRLRLEMETERGVTVRPDEAIITILDDDSKRMILEQ